MGRLHPVVCGVLFLAASSQLFGENRSYDGSGNNQRVSIRGASNQPLARITYPNFEGLIDFESLPLPRNISNSLSAQSESIPNARGLSDFIWVWGQFVAHDLSLSLKSDGAERNGSMAIHVRANDPLGPGPIPFVRSDYVEFDSIEDLSEFSPNPTLRDGEVSREQINVNTSYLDASTVYGSNEARALALRTNGGTGPRLLAGDNNLLPRNTMGLENENVGRFPDDQLFVAGDLRSNEHPLLAGMHTVFMREHNRLVDRIQNQQPELNDEETFQLARKLVGAQVQAITYNEFLPALLGERAPRVEHYRYSASERATVTQSFSHAINRWGHTATSPQLQLVGDSGQSVGHMELHTAFSNPDILADEPRLLDEFMRGAASQVSQEIDLHVVDALRNFLFGPPGAGGLDLVSLNIQRGRDHALPDSRSLSRFYRIRERSEIDDETLTAIEEVYGQRSTRRGSIDPWIGAFAETHLPDSSLGALASAITMHQFERLRDGDRLFYTSRDAGMYQVTECARTCGVGELLPEIRELVDLDTITLAKVIEANTSISSLQDNVFFAAGLPSGDFNLDGAWNCKDLAALHAADLDSLDFDMNGDGHIDRSDVDDDTYGWLTIGKAHNQDVADGGLFCAGDFSFDGTPNATDIDLLVRAMRDESDDPMFDVNFDGRLDFDDHRAMVELMNSQLGDANLDGIVDFADFLPMSVNFGAAGGWADGDFDGSGDVSFPDFLLLANNFGQRVASQAVPEPSSIVLLGTCLLVGLHIRRKERSCLQKRDLVANAGPVES